jgi:hypothetical protein
MWLCCESRKENEPKLLTSCSPPFQSHGLVNALSTAKATRFSSIPSLVDGVQLDEKCVGKAGEGQGAREGRNLNPALTLSQNESPVLTSRAIARHHDAQNRVAIAAVRS